MRIPGWHKITAIVAAYAIALQALLAVFAVAMPSGIAAAPICQQDTGRKAPGEAPDHGLCAACLAGHCAAPAGGILAIAIVIPWPAATPWKAHVPRDVAAAPTTRREAHFARAPPLG